MIRPILIFGPEGSRRTSLYKLGSVVKHLGVEATNLWPARTARQNISNRLRTKLLTSYVVNVSTPPSTRCTLNRWSSPTCTLGITLAAVEMGRVGLFYLPGLDSLFDKNYICHILWDVLIASLTFTLHFTTWNHQSYDIYTFKTITL